MKKEEAIKRLEEYRDMLERVMDCECPSFTAAIESLSAETEWIPVSERLPEEETDVLVTRTFLGCKDGSRGWNAHIPPKTYVEVAQYFNGEWTALSDDYKVARSRHTDPVAWQPLPKPYREESEVEK